MFGSSFFRDDPLFNNSGIRNEFERMDQMMASMQQSFGMGRIGMPPMMLPGHQMHQSSSTMSMMPFGRSMIPDMNSMMSSMSSGQPNGQFYSSSKVISYSSNGTGQPKYYEASSETMQGPGGVRQTRKSERNSHTGIDRMAVGHHINDRGHVIERSRNTRTNEREEKQDFINLDEDEKDKFHEEWQQKARSTNRLGGRAVRHERSSHRHEPLSITSADHRQNPDRFRARHRNIDYRYPGERD